MKLKSKITSGATYSGRNAVSFATQGCFVEGTQIRLGDGRLVCVEDLLPGRPTVLRPDHSISPVLLGRAGPEEPDVFYFTTDHGNRLGVTQYHPMVVWYAGNPHVMPAMDLEAGDQILVYTPDDDHLLEEVVNIEQRPYSGTVYNFEIEGSDVAASHFVVANGIVTGDLYLQQRVTRRAYFKTDTCQGSRRLIGVAV